MSVTPQPMTRPWRNSREFYEWLAREGKSTGLRRYAVAMAGLVAKIESGAYGEGLHGWTSMHDLLIAQTEVYYPYDGPKLRISYAAEERMEFRYHDRSAPPGGWMRVNEDHDWHRVVEYDQVIPRFEKFLEQIHWVARVKAAE